jgi:hypothetical protein
MARLPCICCENGNEKMHSICETCKDILENRDEVFESMFNLVRERIGLNKDYDTIRCKVITIYNMLFDIEIHEDKQLKDSSELK